MADLWVAAIGLIGVAIGAATTYVTQTSLWRRTARRELYGEFAGQSSLCRDALLDWRHAIKHNGSNDKGKKATERMAGLASVTAQVRIIASEPTSEAAIEVENHMMTLKRYFFEYEEDRRKPEQERSKQIGEYEDYLKECRDRLNAFVTAANRELGHRLLKPSRGEADRAGGLAANRRAT